MAKINREEYELLKSLSDYWKWIARDKNGRLYKFQEKPKKVISFQWNDRNETWLGMSSDRFQFIQWEDDEPYNIAELIEEYESEETEVKNMKWFKKKLDDIEVNTTSLQNHDAIWMLNRVHELYDQLDESVVLSQEWIDEHRESTFDLDEDFETVFIRVRKLQNLLVPKQELPVIPKFVADYIDDRKEASFPLYQAIRIAREDSRFEHSHLREWLWTNKGQETFVRAWLDGFTIEEEQKYYVDLESAAYVAKWDGNDQVDIYTDGISGSDEYELHLTEQEIKDYDERYWPFAVKVEELEE